MKKMSLRSWYNRNMRRIQGLFLILLSTFVVGGYFVYLTFTGRVESNLVSKRIISAVRKYPELSDPKEVKLDCSYHGRNLTVTETLYGSLNQYYKSDPAKKSAYYHNKNDQMVMSYTQDSTVKDLASKIRAIGTDNSLESDQVLDLAACFLQDIPYDDSKAAKILSPDYFKLPVDQLIPRYPYETLFENLGICTDKSYLGAAVFRELGYGVSILTFDSQRHMSVGVEVPAGYGDFGTNYGVMELTGNNFLVGDIPEISTSAGLAVGGINTVPNVTTDDSTTQASGAALSTLSSFTTISDGEVYHRIVAREDTKRKILALQPTLKSAQDAYLQDRSSLSGAESSLATAESNYKNNPISRTYSQYTSAYNQYSKVYNKAKQSVDQYNSLVNQYNDLVAIYRQY